MKKHIWEDLITDDIRAVQGNYQSRMGLGNKPALLCIDNYNMSFGDKREPLLESMKRFPSSCGEAGWDAIEPTRQLQDKARGKGVPIFHTTQDTHTRLSGDIQATKSTVRLEEKAWNTAFFEALAPQEGDNIIYKTRASAFYGTPLQASLVSRGIDTLILCGNSTSGCVRATCLDGYMMGYKIAVIEDCVFDRNWLSHKVNLFDMNCKYSDVMFIEEILDYLDSLK